MECIKYKIFENFNKLLACTTLKNPNLPYLGSLAMHTGENLDIIRKNRKLLEKYFPQTASFVSVSQVHEDKIIDITSKTDRGWQKLDENIEADAIVTAIEEVVLTILTADCVPVLMYDPKNRVISAVHAGWRGSEKNIVAKTVKYMQKKYKCNPSDIVALIAPAIGGCCYEVDNFVASKFTNYKESVVKKSDTHYMLDLKSINKAQLIESGLKETNIELSSICTSCNSKEFFSYRKERGCTGRFISAIMMK